MGKVTIKREKCKGCSYCVMVCKKGLLSLDYEGRNRGGYPVAAFSGNEEECTGCALCAEVCPDVALEVFR